MLHVKVYKRRARVGLPQNGSNINNECCWVPGTPVKEHRASKGIGLIELNKSVDDDVDEGRRKVYKRRAKVGLPRNDNNNGCSWVPGTPVKEHRASEGTGLIDLNTSIDDERQALAVSEVFGELNEEIDVNNNEKEAHLFQLNVANPAYQESANLSLLLSSGKEAEPESQRNVHARISCSDSKIDGKAEERESGNYLNVSSDLLPNWNDANNARSKRSTNSSESHVSQSVQQNVPEEVLVRKEEDEVPGMEVENLKKGLKRVRKQKPKRKKIRPKVLVEGKPKKTPQSKTPKPKKTPQPKTLKPVTPKCATETSRKRKYVRKNVRNNFVSGDVVDESVSKKRKSARLSSKKNSDVIIELPPPKTCRQALNFDLESKDDKAILVAIPECGVQVDEYDITKAISEHEIQVDECLDTRKQCENNKTRSTRSRRRRRLNTLFLCNLPVLQVQYPRRRRILRRATRRCNITILATIPKCNQLPNLHSKQAAPSEIAISMCSLLPKFPSKQGAPIENAIPLCCQLPKLRSRKAASSEKEEAEIVYGPKASKNMLLTNDTGRNVAGRIEIKPCVFYDEKNEGSRLIYEDFPLTRYLIGIDSQNAMIRKHPLELENFGPVDQNIGSQKFLQEPEVGTWEGLQEHRVFSQEFLQEQRMGALPLLLDQRIDSPALFLGQNSGVPTPFPGQPSGVLAPISGQSMGAKELLAQQNVGILRLFLEKNIGALKPSLDQSNGALELFPRQAINSPGIYSSAFLKEQEPIIGPSSQQVLQEQDPVIQKKSLKPEDLWLTAKSRGSQGMIKLEGSHLPTRKRSPFRSRGSQVGMNQQLMQPNIADIIRKFEALKIIDKIAYGRSSGQGAVVPYQVKVKPKKLIPEVDLDPGTLRMWNLIMNIDDATSKDRTIDEDMEKQWEKEREVFEGRIQSFTARMHLVLGDRRFKPWKGSVVDSVVGVYLTQNVSDNFSSSAYMSLAARFPLKSASNPTESDENFTITSCQESIRRNLTSNGAVYDSEGNMYFVDEPEPDRCCELKDMADSFDSRIQGKSSLEIEDMRVMKNEVTSQKFDTSSVKSLNRIQLSPTGNLKGDVEFPSNTCSVKSSVAQLSLTGNSKADVTSPNKASGVESSITQLFPAGNLKADVASPNKTCSAEHCITQLSPIKKSKADVASPSKTCSVESSFTLLSSTEYLKADVASPNKSDSMECSIAASTEIPHLENTTSLQNLHDKVDGLLFCDECLGGYITSTRMDNESKASTSGRNNLKSDCRSISLTDFNNPFEISVFPLNQESSRTDLLQADDATIMSMKSSRGKEPMLKEPNSDLKNDRTKRTTRKKKDDSQEQQDWDILRRIYSNGVERSPDQMDSVDWEAVRCAELSQIADAIKERGQQNRLAGRIKDFLNRLVELHGIIDLEWLRNVPPNKVKEYLLDIQGLGLKSVECVRLLSLQHIAFPVDVNVGRIAVRLGWVPLQPLPGDLHIHLLEEYPVMDTIQKYLWPRLCSLDQKTLYELHYQMITFGKIFCKKKNPNCGACPLRGECKHFASAFASARLALPAPSMTGILTSKINGGIGRNPLLVVNPIPMICLEADPISEFGCQTNNCQPIIEEPQSPGTRCEESPESNIDNDYNISDIEDIPTIRLQEREFKENIQNFIEMNKPMIQDSSALVVLTAEAASIPAMKLKKYAHLRTEHTVYLLPDSHELLRGFERRDPDDPSPYLLAIWFPGETPNSIIPPQYRCNSKDSQFCNMQMCYSCNSTREKNAGIVRGTILIPCRSANRGRFPLNGTYFQVNEVFADHETSYNPINVPRHMIANLPRQKVFFGTSVSSIFNALHLREIQECFWRGFVCTRGYDRRYRCPRPLTRRLHCPPSKMEPGSKRSRDET